MSEIVTYAAEGRVAVITLNRPDARNAVNGDVAEGLESAVDQLEADDDVWVGILTANTEGQDRPVFCAGADLGSGGSTFDSEKAGHRVGVSGHRDGGGQVTLALFGCRKPGGHLV